MHGVKKKMRAKINNIPVLGGANMQSTRFLYISPSSLPSRSANSIHVISQCVALAELGIDVTLVARRIDYNRSKLREKISDAYGVDVARVHLATVYSPLGRFNQLAIAIRALFWFLHNPRPQIVLSRNLIASWLVACVLKQPLLYEVHELELGWRRKIQRAIVARSNVTTITISSKLKQMLAEHVGLSPTRSIVLHDAATVRSVSVLDSYKSSALEEFLGFKLAGWKSRVGYFGQILPGRGVEVIQHLAAARPDILFLIFGGDEREVLNLQATNVLNNLKFMGHIQHKKAQNLMAACDILLMPYQRSVSIGVRARDTAQWMSPLKMFEYLASGSAIISSDLPVLREVLTDNKTALLADPESIDDWLRQLDKLVSDPNLRLSLGKTGREAYLQLYTWERRAQTILCVGKQLKTVS